MRQKPGAVSRWSMMARLLTVRSYLEVPIEELMLRFIVEAKYFIPQLLLK